MEHMKKGDNIVLSVMEHHANIVPWHFLRERMGVELKWVDIDDHGNLDPQKVIDAIDKNTKLVAITHMSNVLGTIVDVKTICHAAKSLGVATLIDGSQGQCICLLMFKTLVVIFTQLLGISCAVQQVLAQFM